MKLYHVEWCPDCEVVRRKLAEHDFPYEEEIVPDFRPMRQTVFTVSGQYYVPVLVDGETILTETHEILAHLDMKSEQRQDPPPPLISSDERNVTR